MKIERQAAMVKSVAKNMRAKERADASKEKIKDRLYKILRKAGKPLDEVTRNDVTLKDYDFLVEYVTEGGRYPVSLYPNLQ